MTHIYDIPVPDIEQIIVGIELIIILYLPKLLVDKVYRKSFKIYQIERSRIIKLHVKDKHDDKLKVCSEGDCPSLRNSHRMMAETVAVVEADLMH